MNRSNVVRVGGCWLIAAAAACSGEKVRSSPAGDSATTTAAAGAPRVKTNYVGLQYDSLPLGFTYQSGGILPRKANGPKAEYDFARVATPRGEMVWLDTIGAPVGHGLRARIVRAELIIPPLARDERLFMSSCDANGKLDAEVVAIVVNEAGVSRFTKIRQAWRVNIPAARFDLIPVAGIVCEDPGS